MSFVNDYVYMEPMATFTTWDWVEIYSTEYFYNAKVHVYIQLSWSYMYMYFWLYSNICIS